MKTKLASGAEKSLVSVIKKYFFAVFFIWTLVIAGLAAWEYKKIRNYVLREARSDAVANYDKDVAFREWAAMYGGVYVPVDETTKPNPYLKNIRERDLFTPSGRHLTLLNTAYMARLVNDFCVKNLKNFGHITSLKLLNPNNKPDAWEKTALLSFERGVQEAVAVSSVNGNPFLRLMRPLLVRKACLECHAVQGYSAGDIRGGVSVSIALGPYYAEAWRLTLEYGFAYAMMWLIGTVGLFFGHGLVSGLGLEHDELEDELKSLNKQLQMTLEQKTDNINRLKKTEEKISSLLNEKEILLKEVHHRIKNNMNNIVSLLALQANRLHNPEAVSALKDAQGRVHGMMLLYDRLYCSHSFMAISFKEYVMSLIADIVANFSTREQVKVEMHIEDFIVDTKTLSVLGIIINELITNAMKYAFSCRDEGLISISAAVKDNKASMVIEDNGIGIPEYIDIETSTGFGLELVCILIKQLKGSLRIERLNSCAEKSLAQDADTALYRPCGSAKDLPSGQYADTTPSLAVGTRFILEFAV